MPSVLIVTSGALCRNPRVLKEATTLGRSGFDVTVATIANIERFEAYDREVLAGAPFKVRSLDRVSHGPVTRIVDFAERARSWYARRAIASGRQTPTALGPYSALLALARDIPADLTIVHTELPFCIGVDLISDGRMVAADFEDWHTRDLLAAAQTGRPLRLLAETEATLMRRSAYVSAPSEAMAAALHEAFGGEVPIVVPNTFPLQPDPGPAPRNDPPAFFWFSQTIGEGRGLEEFIAAWAMSSRPSRLSLLGDISPSYREKLLASVSEARRSSLSFLPITSPEKLPGVIAGHDIGLALEPRLPESRYLTATNKIFQYMNAGLAVLATATAGQLEVFANAPGCGEIVNLEPANELSRKIDAVLSDPAGLAAMAASSRRAAVATYCWEKSSAVLVAAVKGALRQKDSA